MLATVTHDLKTPLNGILHYSSLSKSSARKLDFKLVDKYLDIITKNAIFLQNMIYDILDFSSMNNSKLRLNKTWFNLYDLIRDLEELFEYFVIQKETQLLF